MKTYEQVAAVMGLAAVKEYESGNKKPFENVDFELIAYIYEKPTGIVASDVATIFNQCISPNEAETVVQ